MPKIIDEQIHEYLAVRLHLIWESELKDVISYDEFLSIKDDRPIEPDTYLNYLARIRCDSTSSELSGAAPFLSIISLIKMGLSNEAIMACKIRDLSDEVMKSHRREIMETGILPEYLANLARNEQMSRAGKASAEVRKKDLPQRDRDIQQHIDSLYRENPSRTYTWLIARASSRFGLSESSIKKITDNPKKKDN